MKNLRGKGEGGRASRREGGEGAEGGGERQGGGGYPRTPAHADLLFLPAQRERRGCRAQGVPLVRGEGWRGLLG